MVSLAGASAEFTHKEGKAIIQVASLFNQLLQHFPRMEFGALVKENNAERCAKGLVAGHSWSRCYSANSPSPIPFARFATAWAVVWANWFNLALPRLPINPRFPMP